MALPASRNTTYAPGSQVKSADLNAIQDCIIAGHAGTRRVGMSDVQPILGTDTTWKHTFGQAFGSATSFAISFHKSFDLTVGDVVTIQINLLQDNAISGGSIKLAHRDVAGADGDETLVSTTTIATSSSPQTITLVSGHTVVDADYYIYGNFGGASAGDITHHYILTNLKILEANPNG